MGQARSVATNVLHIEIESQMLFLVLSAGNIMLSLGKKIRLCFDLHRTSTYTSLLLKSFAIFP